MPQYFAFFSEKPQFLAWHRALVWGCLIGTLGLAGCSPPKSIRRYEVNKPAPTDRMLAAIIPHGEQAWFLKVSGKNAALGQHAGAFEAMVRSLKFGEDGKPQWQAPADWKAKPETGPRGPMSARFATLEIPGEGGPYELTITPLGLPPQDQAEYVLANVNRWRGQLGLRPLSLEQLPTQATQFDLAGDQVTLVNLEGSLGGGASPMSPPFAGGGARPGPVAPRASASPSSIKFDTPEGWQPGDLVVSRGGIQIRRQAVFNVEQDGKSVEITATQMPGDPSSLLINVNRWRGQVQLDPVSADELTADSKKIELDGAEGTYVQLIGAKDAILGVVAFRDGMAWFIKLQGDHDLAIQERAHFDEFLQSIRFQ